MHHTWSDLLLWSQRGGDPGEQRDAVEELLQRLMLLTLLLSIMYGALLPALRSLIKLLLLLKAGIHRDAPLRLFSLFFFLSFVSLLLFASSVPHPLTFFLFSLYPHSFIHSPLLSFSTSISSLLLLVFFSFTTFSHFPSYVLSFLTSFSFICLLFVSCPPFPYLLPHLLFPSLFPLSPLLISSLLSLLPHLYPPSLISCFLTLSFSVTMSSFFSFPLLHSSPTLPACPPSPHAPSSFPSYAVFTLFFSTILPSPSHHLLPSFSTVLSSFLSSFSLCLLPSRPPSCPPSFLSPSFPPSSLSSLSWLYECVLDLQALRRALLSPRRCSVFGMRR